jgi:thioredoxin reductase (NADPH)
MAQTKFHNIGIIGLGPAGIAAVNQFKRYNIAPLVLTQHEPGGLLKNADTIYNYLGFSAGIAASTLINEFTQTLAHLNNKIVYDEVMQVDYLHDQKQFSIKTKHTAYFVRYLIIATGTVAKSLDLTVPVALESYIYAEPYPLFEMKNKTIVIIGSGDSACVYALRLFEKNKVVWCIRGDTLKANSCLMRSIKDRGIQYKTNMNLSHIMQGNICALNIIFDNQYTIEADFLISAIGRNPALNFMSLSLRDSLKNGLLQQWIYFAGDVQNDQYRQIAIAQGEGVRAAMQVYQSMNKS